MGHYLEKVVALQNDPLDDFHPSLGYEILILQKRDFNFWILKCVKS